MYGAISGQRAQVSMDVVYDAGRSYALLAAVMQ